MCKKKRKKKKARREQDGKLFCHFVRQPDAQSATILIEPSTALSAVDRIFVEYGETRLDFFLFFSNVKFHFTLSDNYNENLRLSLI